MSDDACVVGENSSDVDEESCGRPAGGGSCWDKWYYPGDVEKVKCDGNCEMTLV